MARGFAAPALENVAQEVALVPAKAVEPHTTVVVDDPDDVVVIGELGNENLAKQLSAFIKGLQEKYAYIGVSAFLLLALSRRMRLYVWYGLQRVDIVQEYAAWAAEAITTETSIEAIGCIVSKDEATGDENLRVPEDARDVNHWVACVHSGDCHGDGVEAVESHGDGALANLDGSSDDTRTFAATYLSVNRIAIGTIADGTCGLDVMCWMLGLKRDSAHRQVLRCNLSAFVLRHVGNRALVQSLFTLGEADKQLGLFELTDAGAVVLADAGHDASASHGDGCSASSSHGNGEVVVRACTDEERLAVRWKCGLHAASPEAVMNVLRALPEWCLEQAVTDYKARGPMQKPAPRTHIILARDSSLGHKLKAAKKFVEYSEGREGGLSAVDSELLAAGKMPYGLFAEFVKEQAQLAYVYVKTIGSNMYQFWGCTSSRLRLT